MIGERGAWGALNAARTGLPLHPSDVCVCWGYRGGDVRVLKVQRSGCVCIVGNMYTCMHQGHTCILAVQRALTLHAFLPSSQIRTRWPHNNVGWSCWLLPKLCVVSGAERCYILWFVVLHLLQHILTLAGTWWWHPPNTKPFCFFHRCVLVEEVMV